jgi:hypothetical protein
MATAPRSSASRIGKAGEARADASYDGVASTTGGRRWPATVPRPLPAARSSLRMSSRAAAVVAQRPHGCVALRRVGREQPEPAGAMDAIPEANHGPGGRIDRLPYE